MDSEVSFFNHEDFKFHASSSVEEESSNRIFLTLTNDEILDDGEMLGFISLSNKQGLKRGKIVIIFESKQYSRTPRIIH